MRTWLSSSTGIAWASKLGGAVIAVLGATGGLVKAIREGDDLLIAIAAIVEIATLAGLVFVLLQKRAEGREAHAALLRRPPARVRDLHEHQQFYELGVDFESPSALNQLGLPGLDHAPYVRRDVDDQLRDRLREAGARQEPTLVVVHGPSKAGKSRTLAEAVAATLPDAWLLAPGGDDPRSAFVSLAHANPPKQIRTSRAACLVWLEDLESFAGDDAGLRAIRALKAWRRPVVVVATAGGKGVSEDPESSDGVSNLLRRYPPVRLSAELTDDERARVPGDLDVRSIGEFMISAEQLVERYLHVAECPEGVAVARAVVDWRRIGLIRPIPGEVLEQVYGLYLNGPAGHDRFRKGLEWATTPVYSHTALVQGRDPYQPYDYIASYETQSIPDGMWTAVIDEYATAWEQHVVGIAADRFGLPEICERAFRRGDERGDAGGAFNLAVLLRQRGEVDAAEAAELRGEQHATDAMRQGAEEQTREHLRLAEESEQRGDIEFALTMYRALAESEDVEVATAARAALDRLAADRPR